MPSVGYRINAQAEIYSKTDGDFNMIEFVNVVKRFPNGTLAVNGVSFSVADGEMLFIHGNSDSGKTTLRKLMLLEESTTSGDIYFDDLPLSGIRERHIYKYRRKIGVVFREGRMFAKKTVKDNFAFALRALECPERDIAPRTDTLLRLVGLENALKKYPDMLTPLERQRAEIARAMATNPRLIIADEPTASLDPESALAIMELLVRLNARGKSVVVFTKDDELARSFGKRMIKLSFGQIVEDIPAPRVERVADIRLPETPPIVKTEVLSMPEISGSEEAEI